MCHTYTKHFLSFVFFLTAAYVANAQTSFSTKNGENAPYSQFGIGEQRNGVNTLLKGMGSISSAYSSSTAVNTDNPASYASLRLTTYEGGFEGSSRTILAPGNKYRVGMGNLTHMNVGIPIGKYMGMVIALRPNTRMYYQLDDTGIVAGFGNAYRRYVGQGTTNYGFLGLAGKYKGFSLGANFGYMFGTITKYASQIWISDSAAVQNSVFTNLTKVGGIYWKGGAMYETKLNKKLSMRLGTTVTLNQELSGTRDVYWESVSGQVSGLYDTAYKNTNVKGKISLPMSFSGGAHLYNTDKWMVGVDFTSTNWSQYSNYGLKDSMADNAYKVSVGGEYTPNATSLRKYFQRVTYRLGFYYGTDPIMLRGTQLDYYAVTAGLSLPFKRSADRLHLAFEAGSRGTQANGLLKENFVRVGLGISLNDKWFIKRRYE